jgi:hypothetical protein
VRAGLSLAGLSVSLSLAGCVSVHEADPADAAYTEEITAGLEQIYITRTTRTEYIQGATPACAAAPFPAASEQHYDTWTLALSAADGRIAKTHERRIGEFMACFGPVAPNGTFALYSRGTHGAMPYTATGECKFMKSKPPAPKLLVLNCSADLSELPSPYVGGYLTTSSLAPSGGKDARDVRGYLSTSVITMRLWKSSATQPR